MNRILHLLAALLVFSAAASAQQGLRYTDARSLTVVGKLCETVNFYDRIDADKYPGMTSGEKGQAAMSAGIMVAFSTDSPYIGVDAVYRKAQSGGNSSSIATKGFDLYVRDTDGRWKWAANGMPAKTPEREPVHIKLSSVLDATWKDCLLYLPLFSSLNEVMLVTSEDSGIRPLENPFKGRVAVLGSSFTHGSGVSRPGMSWSAQLSRMTGWQFINLGFSGNCKLQPYFAQALADARDIDAYIIDGFSNPTPQEVGERLKPFIEILKGAKPDVPVIFLNTIYREKRNFSGSYSERENGKQTTADELMTALVKQYPQLYWINDTCATDSTHEWTSDGTHPDDYGYYLWALSVKDRIMEILQK